MNYPKVRENVFPIEKNYLESQHYVAASDLVITKAVWSTLSEAIVSNRPLLIIERKNIPEDVTTIDYLKNKGVHTISLDYLLISKIGDFRFMKPKNVPSDKSYVISEIKRLLEV